MNIAIVQKSDFKILHIYEAPVKKFGALWGDLDLVEHVEFDNSILAGDIKAHDDGLGNIEIIAAPDSPSRAYNKYVKDIDSEMSNLFKTTNRDKASSMVFTWMLMVDYPDKFSNKSLTDDDGNALDSDELITAFAQSKLNSVIDYGVFLLEREKQFKDYVEG